MPNLRVAFFLAKVIFAEPKGFLSAARYITRAEQFMIGPVVKQYGSFRLHQYAICLKGGRHLDQRTYFVVVGDLAIPLLLPLRTGRRDPHGYSSVVNDRKGPFRGCVHVGEIPIRKSTYLDLHDHVDRWLKDKQTGIDCYTEQLAAEYDLAKGNRRRKKFYRDQIIKMEAEYQIVSDSFHAFLEQYPDAAVATKRNAAVVEREARRVRKRYSKGIRLINRVF
ncbi:MAG: hypothetical protein ACYDAR_12850 [Thermomicrobiales bacterium]